MSFDAQKLFELLPAIYRVRDAEQGGQLKALLGVVAAQFDVLQDDLAQLYDDQFIETCAPWVVPYIGDLIGYRDFHTNVPNAGIPRAEVAHTIAFRRRKGTAAMLEQLARDVTGWNARVLEFFQILAWTQHMNHLRVQSRYAPDLRQHEVLERLNGAFDTIAHTLDMRHPDLGGKYNIHHIGIYFWRLDAYSLTQSPAVPVLPGDTRRFLFNSLGLSQPLFTRPEPETRIDHLAQAVNVPDPISRRILDAHLSTYYGPGKSIYVEGFDLDKVTACNLADAGVAWAHVPAPGFVAIDPVLGRVAFGDPQPTPPLLDFHYGFSAAIGGGEYERSTMIDPLLQPVAGIPAPNPGIQGALLLLSGGGAAEISDNGQYTQTLAIEVDADKHLELRAADQHRPTIHLSAPLEIVGGANSSVTLSGLVITGAQIRISMGAGNNQLKTLQILDCTLVPAAQACLVVEIPGVEIRIVRSIVGGLRVVAQARISISDSIVDAMQETGVAICALDDVSPAGALSIESSTVIGKVHTEEMTLASNSIFYAELAAGDPWGGAGGPGTAVRSDRKQDGCVRFCCLPWSAIVPRRHRCAPASKEDISRVYPQFTSTHYGDPGYGQLALATPTEIRSGAEDEAEMGVFHHLYQPQREANVRLRMKEYLRFGLEAGIYYVT